MLLCYNISVLNEREEMIKMKYLVHYYVEGFGGQKEYFKTLKEAKKFIEEKITTYAEDVEIIKL